ncbi:AraC-like DNA-binding protein [Larkinella arboricola]|uniref:AraC-like DNA-binding protein n=1 Tax=Larkinella arboricola TaxID=643671 RepID=A0A327WHZ7_LARAB|nr:helix-turn-helix domain-containing protein [Larkinella arboricola]RAJ91018.1 AraC-like DNA-binding protein [Larkinella arboricola]
MQVIHQLPHPALTPYVHGYWEIRYEVKPGETHPLSFGCTGRTHWLIFLENMFQTSFDDGQPLTNYNSMFIGQMIRPFTHQLTTPVQAITIDFTPTGFYQLFAQPAHELAGLTVDTKLGVGPSTDSLVDQLRNEPSRAVRFGLLDVFFLRRLHDTSRSDNQIETAVKLLQQQPGCLQVRQLADLINCSERTLNRRFTQSVGLSPKEYARVQRFLQARLWMDTQPAHRWGDMLTRLGYYDQAHFINEFRYFAGKPPGVYFSDKHFSLDFMRER